MDSNPTKRTKVEAVVTSNELSPQKPLQQQQQQQHHNFTDFASLPSDVLISILCRSPASDHTALSNTCKAFRSTLNSSEFKGERAISGWAEVSTYLLSGQELYDSDYPNGPEDVTLDLDDDEYLPPNATEEERAEALRDKICVKRDDYMMEYYSDFGNYDSSYGWHDMTQEVYVDGKRVGHISSVLFPRGENHNYIFHEATDAHSNELQMIGWQICDSVGKVKVKSIKDAAGIAKSSVSKGGYIHTKTVEINQVYLPNDCTNIVSRALRSALCEPKLKGKWTLATAWSDYSVYMTSQEKELQRKINYSGWSNNEEEVDVDDKERIDNRFWECAVLDTKSYLRAGYKQIPETFGSEKREPYWMFTLPHFMNDPIKTFEEVDGALVEPVLPPEPKFIDNEILQIVKEKSNRLSQIMQSVTGSRLIIAEEERETRTTFENYEEMFEEQKAKVDMVQRGEKPDHLSEEQWKETKAVCESLKSSLEDARNEIQQLRTVVEARISSMRDAVSREMDTVNQVTAECKEKVTSLVEKGASIRKSHVIHCSATLRVPTFIDFLMELVPPEERGLVLAELDANGLTPLHCAVIGIESCESNDKDEYLDIIERLLGYGADANAQSTKGVTPLGTYRLAVSCRFDHMRVFGMRRGDDLGDWRVFHRKMEAALKPSGGETPDDAEAKCALLDNDGDDGSEEDVFMDDNSDDEEENDGEGEDDDHVDNEE